MVAWLSLPAPMQLLIIVSVTLFLHQVASQSLITGDQSCPCINITPPGLPQGFGINCASHFVSANAVSLQPAAQCQNVAKLPTWCNSSWCFVDHTNCSLPTSTFGTTNMSISYVTCGYLDDLAAEIRAEQLQHEVIRVVNLVNSGGFAGSYYSNAQGWYGATYTYWHKLLASIKANIEVALDLKERNWPNQSLPYPAAVLRQFHSDYPSSTGLSEACIYATGMGFVDVCISSITMNEPRVRISQFVQFTQQKVFLVVQQLVTELSVADHVARAWAPFSKTLWGMIFGVMFLAAILIAIHERIHQAESFQFRSRATYVDFGGSIGAQVWDAWQTLFGGGLPPEHPVSAAGRLTSMGLAVFVLMCVSAYTANMAAFLVQQQQASSTISSLQDIISDPRLTICCSTSLKDAFVSKLGLARSQVVGVTGQGLVLPTLASGGCNAAGVYEEEFLVAQANGEHCNYANIQFLMTSAQGVSVSAKVGRALQWVHEKMEESGVFENILQAVSSNYVSKCPQPTITTSSSLVLGHEALYGSLVTSGAFFAAGVLISLLKLCRRLAPAPSKKNDEEVGEVGDVMQKTLAAQAEELRCMKSNLEILVNRLDS